jgi:hypothetical protein
LALPERCIGVGVANGRGDPRVPQGGHGIARGIWAVADRPACGPAFGSRPRRGAVRLVLSLRRPGVRRRSCGAALAARRVRHSGLGQRRHFPGGIRRRASHSRPPVQLCRLPRRGRTNLPSWPGRRHPRPDRDLSAGHADLGRHVAILERPSSPHGGARRHARNQCGGGRGARGGAL